LLFHAILSYTVPKFRGKEHVLQQPKDRQLTDEVSFQELQQFINASFSEEEVTLGKRDLRTSIPEKYLQAFAQLVKALPQSIPRKAGENPR